MQKQVVHCDASICSDVNAKVNTNVKMKANANAASRTLHEPIGENAKRECNRITRNVNVPSQIWTKKDMLHAALARIPHVLNLCSRLTNSANSAW